MPAGDPVDAHELLQHLTRASLDEQLYSPEARDGARAMLQQLPGWRAVYLPALTALYPPRAGRPVRRGPGIAKT